MLSNKLITPAAFVLYQACHGVWATVSAQQLHVTLGNLLLELSTIYALEVLMNSCTQGAYFALLTCY